MADTEMLTLDQMVISLVDKFSNNPELVDQVLRNVYALPPHELKSINQQKFNQIVITAVRESQQQRQAQSHTTYQPVTGVLYSARTTKAAENHDPKTDPNSAAVAG